MTVSVNMTLLLTSGALDGSLPCPGLSQKESFPLGTVVFQDTSLWLLPQGVSWPAEACHLLL